MRCVWHYFKQCYRLHHSWTIWGHVLGDSLLKMVLIWHRSNLNLYENLFTTVCYFDTSLHAEKAFVVVIYCNLKMPLMNILLSRYPGRSFAQSLCAAETFQSSLRRGVR